MKELTLGGLCEVLKDDKEIKETLRHSQPQILQMVEDFSKSQNIFSLIINYLFHSNNHIANFEMETSAIYGLCNILGHQCLSINVIVANRVKKEYSKDMGQAVNNMIQKSLAIIEKI
jgi:purine-nucleoside phosphorylase